MKAKLFHLLVLSVSIFIAAESGFSQWSGNPTLNTSICDVMNSQTFPKIGATSDGGFFISWFDNRANGQYKVYLQRLSASGQKMFASDGLLISDKPQNSYFGDYDLVVDSENNAVIVFSDRRNSPGDTILNPFAYKISSGGQFLWGPDGVAISNNSNAYQVWPQAAVLSDGNIAIVWWYINTAQRNSWITMQKLNAAGVPQFSAPINIQDPDGKRYQYPKVCKSDNGNYILSWVYGPKDTVGSFIPDNVSVMTNKFDPNGNNLWGPSHKIVYTNTGNTIPIYCVPRIYPDGNNGAIYSYFNSTSSSIFTRVQRFNSAGTALFPQNGTAGSTNTKYIHVEPYAAYMSSTDETYFFWTEVDGDTQDHQGIFGQRLSPNGSRLWGDNGIAFSSVDTFSIYGVYCFARDTNVVVTYASAYINANIYSFRANRNGGFSWNSYYVVPMSLAPSPKGYIASATNSDGMTASAWLDGRAAGTLEGGGIYAQNVNYNGTIGTVGISQLSSEIPRDYSLSQNFPNPFNNSTVIEFQIKNSGNYKIEIYDMLGRKADDILNGYKTAGSYKINYKADKLTSGTYMYRLASENVNIVKKFILLK